jgi:hypothetical protein
MRRRGASRPEPFNFFSIWQTKPRIPLAETALSVSRLQSVGMSGINATAIKLQQHLAL